MRKIAKILKFGIFLFIIGIFALIGLYAYAYLSPALDIKKSGSFYLYDNKEELIYQGSKTSEWVGLNEVNDNLKNAVISVEDKNFYNHHGFDYLRIGRAMLNNIKNKTIVEGASTISQQYIKNMYLEFDKSWKRKIEEALLTLKLEVHYKKDNILEGYLNTINYGQGNYGIQNASRYYFNKKASNLTLEEALMLAGIPKNPSKYNPVKNYDECVKRAKIVAETMVNNGYMDENTYHNLFKNKIDIYGKNTENNLQMLMYYQDAVLNELENITKIPKEQIETGGLKIYTTLDVEKQKELESSILKNKIDDDVQVASVVTDPKSGAVVALTGGMNYGKSEYNRAISAKRQVGSTMKSFLYYAALENNLTMSSTFLSEATTFNLANGKSYSPTNYGEKYANKDITMAAAVAFSDNIYAVKTNLFLGTDKMINVARLAGITGDLKEVPSLALGTSEINILDYANGYNTLASAGYRNNLYFIEKVLDSDGKVIYEHQDKGKLVLNPNYVYILNEMLTSTTNKVYKDYTIPTGLLVSGKLSRKYALKSGTTNTDCVAAGYNKNLLMVIWEGYDDNRETPLKLGSSVKNTWADSMEGMLKGTNNDWYKVPENVVGISLDAVTGKPSTDKEKSTMFYYLKGTEPYAGVKVNKEN
jgi:membrane peptidoglycan carboxypeptidase